MQANPLHGEVRFKVGEDEFVLAYPINTVIQIEDHFGAKFEDVRARLLLGGVWPKEAYALYPQGPMSPKEIRTFVRFGFAARWPDVTDEQAGEVIGQIGDAEFGVLLAQCFVATFGLRTAEAGEDADRPPAPSAAGTGPSATAPGAATASEPSPSI